MHTNLFAHINCLFKCSARFACISRLIHWLLKSADLHTCFLALLARDCTQTVNVRAFNVVEREKNGIEKMHQLIHKWSGFVFMMQNTSGKFTYHFKVAVVNDENTTRVCTA